MVWRSSLLPSKQAVLKSNSYGGNEIHPIIDAVISIAGKQKKKSLDTTTYTLKNEGIACVNQKPKTEICVS